MPDSLSLLTYRAALRVNPSLGEQIVEIYHHSNGRLSLRYADGRLSAPDFGLSANIMFHPNVLGVVETRFIANTLQLPPNTYADAADNVRMIYIISSVFLELGGGYHFRTNNNDASPSTHHHHRCSRCKKVRTCSGKFCYHLLKLHCDDCNEYFLLKRGTDANNISLDPEASIPTNNYYTGADFIWPAPLTETRPVESRSGRIPSNTYNITFDNNQIGNWDDILQNWVITNDAHATGRTGGNEDGNL